MRKFLIKVIAGTGAVLAFGSAAWAQAQPNANWYPCGPHMMGWGEGGSAMFFGPLILILLLALFVALAALLVRWLGGPWRGTPPHGSHLGRTPFDILRERFARGEIDKDEFEERRKVLGE